MSNEAVLTNEEAHWSAFRSAVAGLQSTLTKRSSVPAETEHGGEKIIRSDNNNFRKHITGDDRSASGPNNPKKNACEEGTNHNTYHQDRANAGDGLEDCNRWDNTDVGTDRIHQRLELIGFEEVNKSSYGRNNNYGDVGPISPAIESSAYSQTTNALSVAEQQLVETKLKLAMTESERDELEFQLMQNR
eukprot:CAMPEP_0181112302 /NCGR_PEP_ID=MMETSP1071-20121207/19741_1 /TAXON_ID=35127 /ORGANISM="Thalassiosira sp., Strain NH16" /LENGTH=188 /DNA_ID=CAMNT_0023196263 /DNA_START=128 /DNA_END=694 /DNA_ORIENTATION=-